MLDCEFLSELKIIYGVADQSRTLEFRLEKLFYGKRLMNHHVIRITAVMVKEFCEILCYIEPDCVSINIDKREDGHGVYKCELNNVTHEGYKQELVDDDFLSCI